MKQLYTQPILTIDLLDAQDVLTASVTAGSSGEGIIIPWDGTGKTSI